MKRAILHLALVLGLLSGSLKIYGNVVNWIHGAWDNGTGPSTGDIVNVYDGATDSLTNCSLGTVNLTSLTLYDNGSGNELCEIAGTVNATTVIIYNNNAGNPALDISGTLIVTNLTNNAQITDTSNTGTINFSGGTLSQTGLLQITNFNVTDGTSAVLDAGLYGVVLNNLTVNATKKLTFNGVGININLLDIYGTIINKTTNAAAPLTCNNVTIENGGNLDNGTTTTLARLIINNKFSIGGTFTSAKNANSYYNFFTSGNNHELALFNSVSITISNISNTTTGVKYLGTLTLQGNSTLTVNGTNTLTLNNQISLQGATLIASSSSNNITTNKIYAITGTNIISGPSTLTVSGSGATISVASGTTTISPILSASGVNTTIDGSSSILKINNSTTTIGPLTLTNGGTFQSINSSAHTVSIGAITLTEGHLLFNPNTTFNYTGSSHSLTMSGSNSSIAYLNKNWPVTINGISDTIRNSIIRELDVSASSSAVVNNSGGYTIGNITSNGGAVTINSLPHVDSLLVASSGGSLTLSSPVRVSNLVNIVLGGSLASGSANLTMLEGSNLWFTTDGQITGTVNIHRKYGSIGWELFGSPFDNTQDRTAVLYSGSGQTDYFNSYKESNNYTGSNRWVGLTTGTNFRQGTGYQVGVGGTIVNDTLVFTGTPHRTNVTVSGLTFTTGNGTTADDQRGYNLVSNPYVAPITISTFFSDNTALTAIYYWDNESPGKGAGRFVTRTNTGVITPSSGLTSSTNISKAYLAPNQGFFIKTLSGGGSVNFTTSEIAYPYPPLNDNFLRAAVEPNFIRLNVDNDSANHDDCIIQFNTAATDTFDAALDVYKLLSPAYPVNIYTYKGLNKFAVQNRQPVTSNLTIPLGLTTTKAQNYKFSITNFDVLSPDINVYLQDNVANRNINLRDSSYTVSLKADTIYSRFKLLFTNGSVNSIINPAKKPLNFQFWSQNGEVFANLGQTPQNITIQAADVTGRVISETHYNSALGNISVPGNYEKNRIYIFNISGSDFHQLTKILIQ
jgi:hypothetical protein